MSRPWEEALVLGDAVPTDALEPAEVAPTDWVRIVPAAFGDFDVLEFKRIETKRDEPPARPQIKVDRKTMAPVPFVAEGPRLACSEAVLRALSGLGSTGWSARPLPHVSPYPVRGQIFYDLELPGSMGKPLPSSFDSPRTATPYGVAGSPRPPVVFSAEQWTGEPLCLSDWLKADKSSPYRAIVARGDFIHALVQEGANPLWLQPVILEGKAVAQSRAGITNWERAPASWNRPTRWQGSVLDRIRDAAAKYEHTLPGPARSERVRQVTQELETRYQGKLDPKLVELLLSSNGPSLFNGMLTFFPIDPRTSANPVPQRSHSVCNEDIASANARVSEDDWRLTRAKGWILFAARYAEMHAMWALSPDGRVHLLSQTGEVAGPDVPFKAWLEDQVADLEWAWDNPAALGKYRTTWLQ